MNGAQLRRLRLRLRLTQKKLGELVGLDPGTISRYERGVLAIPKTVIRALERVADLHGRGEV